MDPPELPVAQLVRLTGLFGISENRARVALSRMVASGEATSDGSGRYRLAGHLAARQSRQSASRAGATTAYDGEWWLAVVTTTGSSAEVRGARRRTLAYGRLAELREGVWMRPANLAVQLPDPLDGDIELMTARPEDAVALAAAMGPGGVVEPAPVTCWTPAVLSPRPARGAGAGVRALGRRAAAPAGRSAVAAGPAARRLAGRRVAGGAYDQWDARYRTTLERTGAGPTGARGLGSVRSMDVEIAFTGVPVTTWRHAAGTSSSGSSAEPADVEVAADEVMWRAGRVGLALRRGRPGPGRATAWSLSPWPISTRRWRELDGSRGIRADPQEEVGGGRKATVLDPDGNTVAFISVPSGSRAGLRRRGTG